MAKNYFKRYVWLVDLINRYGHISLNDINRMWLRSSLNETGGTLPERTFFNHLNAIKETFGITIKCDRSLGYYIVNDDSLETDNLKLWMLQSLSINNIINDSFGLRDRILFEESRTSNKWLTDIVKAMKDGKVLQVIYKYYKPDKDFDEDELLLEPYCLKEYKQRWYLLARSIDTRNGREKTGLNVYAVDRIIELLHTNMDFDIPATFNGKEHFKDYLGVIKDSEKQVEAVEVKVNNPQANYLKSLEIHPSQTEIFKDEDYTVFRYQLIPNIHFVKEIMALGAEAEILKPQWLREKITEEISRLEKIYKNDQIV